MRLRNATYVCISSGEPHEVRGNTHPRYMIIILQEAVRNRIRLMNVQKLPNRGVFWFYNEEGVRTTCVGSECGMLYGRN